MLDFIPVENLECGLIGRQDIAAEQSTMAYRAPELFDVKTGQTIDEKVDIWVRSFPAPNLGARSKCILIYLSSPWVAHYTPLHIRTHPSRILKRQSRVVR
jgi:serine/threonine protein kinase